MWTITLFPQNCHSHSVLSHTQKITLYCGSICTTVGLPAPSLGLFATAEAPQTTQTS